MPADTLSVARRPAGHDEMVVVVSYFYDHEYYDEPAHAKELGEDVDISKYIASGVVAFQLSRYPSPSSNCAILLRC